MELAFSDTIDDRIQNFRNRNFHVDLEGLGNNTLLEFLRDGYKWVNKHKVSFVRKSEKIDLTNTYYYLLSDPHPVKIAKVYPMERDYNRRYDADYRVRLMERAISPDWSSYIETAGYPVPNYDKVLYIINAPCDPTVVYDAKYPIHGSRYLTLPSPYPSEYDSDDVSGTIQLKVQTVEKDNHCLFDQDQFDKWMHICVKAKKLEAEIYGTGVGQTPALKRHKVDIIEHEYQSDSIIAQIDGFKKYLYREMEEFKALFGNVNKENNRFIFN